MLGCMSMGEFHSYGAKYWNFGKGFCPWPVWLGHIVSGHDNLEIKCLKSESTDSNVFKNIQ